MTEQEKEILEQWTARHNVAILDTNKRVSRYMRLQPRYFTDDFDYNYIDQNHIQHHTEIMHVLELLDSCDAEDSYVQQHINYQYEKKPQFYQHQFR